MHRSTNLIVAVGAVLLLTAPGSPDQPPAKAEPAPPFSAQQQQTFQELYEARIRKATSRKAKSDLAVELLAAADKLEGGLKYLVLSSAKDLATAGGDFATAANAQAHLVELGRGPREADLTELMGLRLKHFNVLRRQRVSAKGLPELKKALYALGEEIVGDALKLGGLYRAAHDYAAAEAAERLAEPTAALISSPRLTQLRQGIQISRTLQGLADQARRFVNLEQFTEARWAYLDAGLFEEAAKLQSPQRDETAELVLSVAAGKEAGPAGVFEAAKAWDQRAVGADGALQQIRLARAAELYRRTLETGLETDRAIARVRLQAIERQLGDMLVALKGPAEWIYLVDLQEDSAAVGWGSFGKVTRDKGVLGIAGTDFETGLSVHASSKVVYSLHGRYRQLSLFYGLRTGAGGVASFHVVCDGKKVFDSPWTWSNNTHGTGRPTVLNITGVDKVELITTGHRGGQGAFSAWGDPKVR
ncbi:MAG TPA: NPCBM/NEW2 domain-containing protein [Phycisphaerae bacterium]|nr:NPCBM/NEW2 domain-containing protein [Phycisphaerae bacterium]